MPPTSTNIGSNIPAFLSKLWKMVNDPETDHLIRWGSVGPTGRSFIIRDEVKFWYNLLPSYYKHNNMSSFIRQLNMYGFHKVSTENGGKDCDKDNIMFYHPCFQKEQPQLMKMIKRKIASSKTSGATAEDHKVESVDQISKVLVDVQQLRGRQESVDSQLDEMRQENATLWRELALLRQKHLKQQQIVNKLIHFLVTIVQPSRTGLGGLGVKRRYPLMIDDAKYGKKSKTEFDGPTIHELDSETALTNTLLNEVAGSDSGKTSEHEIIIDSPPSVPLTESESDLLSIPLEDTDNLTEEDPLNPEILLVTDPVLDVSEMITPDTPVDTNRAGFPLKDSDLTDDLLQAAEQMYDKTRNQNTEISVDPLFEEVKLPQIINPNMKDTLIGSLASESEDIQTGETKDSLISNFACGSEDSRKSKAEEEQKRSMAVATRSVPDLSSFKLNSAEELDSHLESTQGDLDNIKDMLFEGYSLDANALLGNLNNPFDAMPLQLFNPDEDVLLDLPPLTNSEENSQNRNDNYDPMLSGTALTTYTNPSFVLDFENLFEDSTDTVGTGNTEENRTIEMTPEVDNDQINTPIIVKKEPTYTIVNPTNSK